MRAYPILTSIILFFVVSSCSMSGSQSNLLTKRTYEISEFEGTYVPKARLSPLQASVFGSQIVISEMEPGEVAHHLLANREDLTRIQPSATIMIKKEIDDEKNSSSTLQYYFFGINQGSLDYVHYDFNDELNTFERNKSTLKGNIIKHEKEMLVYKKSDKDKRTSPAGFTVSYSFQLFGNLLVVTQNFERLGEPWLSVFPNTDGQKLGIIEATFMRVNKKDRRAFLGPYVSRYDPGRSNEN